MPRPHRLLLVDDDPMSRAGIRGLLEVASDLELIAEVGDGSEALEAVRAHRPDVVLMDIRMPRLDGISATRQVRQLPSAPEVIVLTVWDVDDAVIRCIEAGAAGFLLKANAPTELLSGVRAVVAGDAMLSPRSTRQYLDHVARDGTSTARREAVGNMATLTEREQRVAIAVGHGRSNAEIASQLYVSQATVKSHLTAIQTKLNLHNRVMIAVLAERAGLLA